ncbi:MAG: hypothetical protein EBY61_05680, partial [Actinobacteria bacterium]|nr:hypothetical protein [Actinomycetota bacterium]
MHAVAKMAVEGEAIDDEVLYVAEVDGEGPAFPDGDVTDADAANIVQQDDAVGAGDGPLSVRVTADVSPRGLGRRGEGGRPDAAFDQDVSIGPKLGAYCRQSQAVRATGSSRDTPRTLRIRPS